MSDWMVQSILQFLSTPKDVFAFAHCSKLHYDTAMKQPVDWWLRRAFALRRPSLGRKQRQRRRWLKHLREAGVRNDFRAHPGYLKKLFFAQVQRCESFPECRSKCGAVGSAEEKPTTTITATTTCPASMNFGRGACVCDCCFREFAIDAREVWCALTHLAPSKPRRLLGALGVLNTCKTPFHFCWEQEHQMQQLQSGGQGIFRCGKALPFPISPGVATFRTILQKHNHLLRRRPCSSTEIGAGDNTDDWWQRSDILRPDFVQGVMMASFVTERETMRKQKRLRPELQRLPKKALVLDAQRRRQLVNLNAAASLNFEFSSSMSSSSLYTNWQHSFADNLILGLCALCDNRSYSIFSDVLQTCSVGCCERCCNAVRCGTNLSCPCHFNAVDLLLVRNISLPACKDRARKLLPVLLFDVACIALCKLLLNLAAGTYLPILLWFTVMFRTEII